ncbi:MAG: hypothetical protein ACE5JJ_00580 [Nitrospinota bacterium]
MRREIEILCLLFGGYVCLMAGFRVSDFGLQIFLYLMAAMFFLAIFRPKQAP